MPRLKKGIVQVYTGDGKGKTTAALGQALRALQRGLKVYLIQFLKKGEEWDLGPGFQTAKFGKHYSPDSENLQEVEKSVREGLRFAREIVKKDEYDLVILDEINIVLHKEIVGKEEILELIGEKSLQTELILTGRNAPRAILQAADLVTEMVSRKHPYQRGMGARRGIEY